MRSRSLRAPPGTARHGRSAPHCCTAPQLAGSGSYCLSVRARWKCRCSEKPRLFAASLAAGSSRGRAAQRGTAVRPGHRAAAPAGVGSDPATGLEQGDVLPHRLWRESCSKPSVLRVGDPGLRSPFRAPAFPSRLAGCA